MQAPILPTPFELKRDFPLSQAAKKSIALFKQNAKTQLSKTFSNEIYAFVGPCSLHSYDEAIEYATKLKKLANELKIIQPVMRAYIEKPRTQVGYKGLLYQPDIQKKENLREGLITARKLLRNLSEMLPIAIEIVDPYLIPYFEDLISWAFIGARTSSSQIHRQIASKLDCPVGFKNTIDGNTQIAIDAIRAARRAHNFFHLSSSGRLCQKESKGNEQTHLVLRGSLSSTNYDQESLEQAFKSQEEINTPILIDCSHGNSNKDIQKQKEIFLEIIEYFSNETPLLGIMLESYLNSGSQKENSTSYQKGVSITDPCLDFDTTHHLLAYADQLLQKQKEISLHP